MAESVKLSPKPAGRLLTQWETLFSGFPELMVVMQILAGVGQGAGHTRLFDAATNWLAKWYGCFLNKSIVTPKVISKSRNSRLKFLSYKSKNRQMTLRVQEGQSD